MKSSFFSLFGLTLVCLAACSTGKGETAVPPSTVETTPLVPVEITDKPAVYMTTDISPDGLLEV
jgi:hypothetical protein